ncbi:MAG: hypothetical protein AAGI52_06465 [Bacteroidota bacterium]
MPRLDDITIGVSPITERVYIGTLRPLGTSRDDGVEIREWKQKRDITSVFCGALLEWCPPDYERQIEGSGGSIYRIRVEQICPRCGDTMGDGVAIENALQSSEDFGGDAGEPGTTMSMVGTGRRMACRKCGACGYSTT